MGLIIQFKSITIHKLKKIKDMKLENIRTADEIENYIEGCLNDFQLGFRSKEKTVELIGDLVVHIYKLALKDNES